MKNCILSLILLFTATFSSHAQNSNQQDPVVLFSGNTIERNKVQEWANEVYLNCPEYINDELIGIYHSEVMRLQLIQLENIESIGNSIAFNDLTMKNKCNPDLIRDGHFDLATFNPLKYHIGYTNSDIQYIRLPQTGIFIRVQPIQY